MRSARQGYKTKQLFHQLTEFYHGRPGEGPAVRAGPSSGEAHGPWGPGLALPPSVT